MIVDVVVDKKQCVFSNERQRTSQHWTGKWRYTGSHAYNISQLNNKQVFGNNQHSKRLKCEHNRNTTFSDYKFTTQASTPMHNFLLSPIYNTCYQQFTTQAKINQTEGLTKGLQHRSTNQKNKKTVFGNISSLKQ